MGSTEEGPARPDGLARARTLGLVALALLGFGLAYLALRDLVVSDDAYITFRYSENLARGRGFVFNPGERVLGTTTPLFGLLLGLLGALGCDIPTAGFALSLLCVAGTALAGAWLLTRFGHPNLAVLYAFLVLSGILGIYVLAGMETSLYALLLHLGAIAALRRRALWVGVCVGLACFTRYDGVVFAGALFLAQWIEEKRIPWKSVAVAAAIFTPWLAFAWVYYGSPLPNTLHAKSGETSIPQYLGEVFADQVRWLVWPFWKSARGSAPTILGALLAFAPLLWSARTLRETPWRAFFSVQPALLYLGYAIIGPHAGFFWHVLAGTYFFLLAALLGWGELARRAGLRGSPAIGLALLAAGAAALPLLLGGEARAIRGHDGYQRRVSYADLARWFRERGLTDLVVLLDEPGYFARLTDCRIIDGWGLVTKDVQRTGKKEEQTTTESLVARYAPDAIVEPPSAPGLRPTEFPGYLRALCEPHQIFLREEVFRARLDALLTAPHPEEAAPALRHPLAFDFASGSEAGWRGTRSFVGSAPGLAGGPYLTTHPSVSGMERCTVESPPFRVDFDLLAFRFASAAPADAPRGTERAELVVEDQVVLSVDQRATEPGAWSEVRWPVHAWRGKVGRLRFLDFADGAWLAAAGVRSQRFVDALPFEDFERAEFGPRWKATFAEAPLPYTAVAEELGPELVVGRASAVSAAGEGKRALVSAPFAIERDQLAFLFFDLGRKDTRVELTVDGEVVRSEFGSAARTLRGIVWDVGPWRGKSAVLSAVDDGAGALGRVGLDALVFYERAE